VRVASRAALVLSLGGTLLAGPMTPSYASGDTMASKLHRLRMCESHNNYHANTGNGYYGAYQFARGTWKSLGFRGRPDRASRYRQNRAAKKLHRQEGWHPWPSCSRREHLSG
jgi:hypothetical protein